MGGVADDRKLAGLASASGNADRMLV